MGFDPTISAGERPQNYALDRAVTGTVMVCISTHLKSALIYTFSILDACHPDILYLCEQGCEDPWLFWQAERGPRVKKRLGYTERDHEDRMEK